MSNEELRRVEVLARVRGKQLRIVDAILRFVPAEILDNYV